MALTVKLDEIIQAQECALLGSKFRNAQIALL